MAKNLEISILLDYYGNMLTDKQREVVEWYYNEDLSLAEIAEHSGITRQGVRDSIKRAEAQLLDCEQKLGLRVRFEEIQVNLDKIVDTANELLNENQRSMGNESLWNKLQRIIDIAGDIGG